METRLQSKEVRIPKLDFDLTTTAAPCQYFYKSSFARSLSHTNNNTNNNNNINTTNNISHNYNQSHTKSLDFDVNYGLNIDNSPIFEEMVSGDEDETVTPTSIAANETRGEQAKVSNKTNLNKYKALECLMMADDNSNLLWEWDNKHQESQQTTYKKSTRKSMDTTELEVLRLRKECQNLIEENRRLISQANGNGATLGSHHNMSNSVEMVILQTQVETLQWQLKQVDSSRHMYRSVMEEVVRFLERCHQSLDAIQLGAMGVNGGGGDRATRCKSAIYMSQHMNNNDVDAAHYAAAANPTSNRARSSTNLMDVQKYPPQKSQVQQDHTANETSPASSYNNFRDFTWRRSPNKRNQTLPISINEVEPEKLSKEAFRLLRTVQNLLNTQEPLLSQSTTTLDFIINTVNNMNGGSMNNNQSLSSTTHNTINLNNNANGGSNVENNRNSFCLAFNRKLNIRDSRLSLRSSTDDSVHSHSSSSKTETDEDNTDRPSPPLTVPPPPSSSSSSSVSSVTNQHNHLLHHQRQTIERMKEMIAASSAEDESGFSSMNSFQEIGLPLINSTMISTTTSSAASTSDESSEMMDTAIENKVNKSSKAKISFLSSKANLSAATNNAAATTAEEKSAPALGGVANATCHQQQQINHRRWSSAPVVPPKLQIHSSTTSKDTLRELWV